ncbi:PQQ-binding-like beta-propeller repeat protein [Micromonospora sp. NPDC049836]|uniref:outer membrane protein assembly factor BamB family protein n=1 Tax=Micromonospora sp. NPDC049836 TaxID=3364274 RepID=UPI0037B0AF1F
MTVIDLGDLREAPTPDRPARRPRAGGRVQWALLVLVVSLLTLAGAVPVAGRVAITLPGGPAAAGFLAGGRVYLVQPPDPARGVGRELVAYRLDRARRARVLWRTPLPVGGLADAVWRRDGVVLLIERTRNDTNWDTVAFDVGTGRLAWRQSGVAYPIGDGVLLYGTGPAGNGATRRVDPATGRTLWTVPSAGLLQLGFGPAGIDRLVRTVAPDRMEVYDPVSGARLVARALGFGAMPSGRLTALAAGLLLVGDVGGGTLTGYDLATLEPRWTVPFPPMGHAETCGRLLCVLGETGGMRALDPATGATRWTDDRWSGALTAAGGRLLVTEETAAGTELAVVEEATGRLVAGLGTWTLIPQDESDGRITGMRPAVDGRLLVAELDPAAGAARIREALPHTSMDCKVGGELLLCRRVQGGFGVWRTG